jgi:C4-dicarboxylate-binding protein DctP
MRQILNFKLIILLFFVFQHVGYADDKLQFRVSDAMPASSSLGKLVADWARNIERENNNIEVILYSGSQLFKPEQQINAVARAYINGAFIHFDYWGRTLPELSILSRPFAFSDRELLYSFRDSLLCRYLTDRVETKGMKVVAWLIMGHMIGISTPDKPLVKPKDFAHTKIRGASPLLNSALRAVGASPVTLGGAEVYQALQTGMIDGSLTTLRSIYMRRFYEVNNWVTVSPLFPAFMMLTVNLDWWNSLSEENRQIINRVSLSTERAAAELIEKLEAETPQLLRDKGMNVYFLTAEEIEELRSVMEPEWISTFNDLIGERGKEVLQHSADHLVNAETTVDIP